MHILIAAEQLSVTISSPLGCSSTASLFHQARPSSKMRGALSSISSCTDCFFKCGLSSSLPVTSYKIAFQGRALPIRSLSTVVKSGNRLSESHGHDRLSKRKACIKCLASRKDRREAANGEEEFEADIASLRTGFSKRFPGQDSSAFEYELDDDGVEAKLFKGGEDGRARSRTTPNHAGENYSYRERNESHISSRPGRSREEFSGNERRRAQGNGMQGAGFRDSRDHRGMRGEADRPSDRTSAGSWSESSSKKPANDSRRPWIERGDVARSSRSSGETRGNDSSSRVSRDGGRIAGTNGNVGARKTSDSSRPVRTGKEAYGGGEWQKDTPIFEDDGKKKKPVIEPVNFTSALSKSPHVAILGGGMSGLVCALTLEGHGIQSTVFDTGKHGLGGRMATRYVEEHDGERLVFDHAAQFFTATDPRFQNLVDRWILEGIVKNWNGKVGTLQAGGQYSELPPATRYIGTNGMRSLADSMLSQSRLINVKRPCWISRMDAMDGRWTLTENRKPQGEFDVVVIAHNGKCANRLLSTAHVPLIARQMKRLELSSIWALLAAFKESLPLPGGKILDGAFVDGVDSLSWMGNNSSKLVLPDDKSPQCWTFFSTAAYGKRNKVPQESIPLAKAAKVKEDMLRGVAAALGLSEDSLPTPIYTRLQLWGAALPINTPDVPCIFDAQGRVGICGDWLVGSSLEAAALSGMALADHIAKYSCSGDQDGQDFNVGLEQTFTVVKGSDIGQFPGTEEMLEPPPQETRDSDRFVQLV